jgi:hypothetical protein
MPSKEVSCHPLQDNCGKLLALGTGAKLQNETNHITNFSYISPTGLMIGFPSSPMGIGGGGTYRLLIAHRLRPSVEQRRASSVDSESRPDESSVDSELCPDRSSDDSKSQPDGTSVDPDGTCACD